MVAQKEQRFPQRLRSLVSYHTFSPKGLDRLSFTARIEGAYSDHAASASKKEGLAFPVSPTSQAATDVRSVPSVRLPRWGPTCRPSRDAQFACRTESGRNDARGGETGTFYVVTMFVTDR